MNVTSTISPIDNDITSHSIHDCFCLGQYQEHADQPHPIFIKFTRAIDAVSLLLKCSSLPDKITIKPDMSQAKRFIESLLLKVGWHLIQSGTNLAIRIQSKNIFVDNKLHERVHNSSFELVPAPPSLPSISNSSATPEEDTTPSPHTNSNLCNSNNSSSSYYSNDKDHSSQLIPKPKSTTEH